MSDTNQKGVSIIFVILMASVVLSIAFGVSGILIKQVIALRGVGNSVVAFFAADAGIEQFLLTKPPEGITGELSNDSTFRVDVRGGELGNPTYVKSVGTFAAEKRAIEIMY